MSEEKRCRHWWIDCGRKTIKGVEGTEYRCDICGEIAFVPIPGASSGRGLPHQNQAKRVRGGPQ